MESGSEGMTLERIDVNQGYTKANCTWVPLERQASNKTTTFWVEYQGRRQSLKDWCNELNLAYVKTFKRLKYLGWSVEKAFTKEIKCY